MAEKSVKESETSGLLTADNVTGLVYVRSERMGVFRRILTSGYKQNCLLTPLTEAEQNLLTCPACGGILKNPVIMKSSEIKRTVCKICVEGAIMSEWPQGTEAVDKLNAKCPLEIRGCNWRGKLEQIERHLSADCSRLQIECKLRCGEVLLRKDEEKHTSETCEHRKIHCEYCGVDSKAKEHQMHTQICPEMPVTCPNNCSSHGMKRREVDAHLAIDCPLTEIQCQYFKFGCNASVKREDMSRHLELEVHKHLALVTQLVVEQGEQIAKLLQRVGEK